MLLVIFHATLRDPDPTYTLTAARMRELALGTFGCVRFESVQEGDREMTISYWNSETDITAWKDHPEHRKAQELGRSKWYAEYRVEVARLERAYQHPPGERRGSAEEHRHER